jgi:3-isopropylmalate/(R)-2-methylmalate dehydratase small subunit
MQKFTRLTGLVAPLDRANVDTDTIIPKQFLKSIRRSGFGPHLFDGWRYLDHGELGKPPGERKVNPEFSLNEPRYQGAQILLTRDNFGCGSSREHAVWALQDYGFRALISSSFADIFSNNCFKNGLLPIVLPVKVMNQLFEELYAQPGYRLSVDLEAQRVTTPSGEHFPFAMAEFPKYCLLNGLDDIDMTLRHVQEIKAYEKRWRGEAPWLFTGV